MFLPKGTNVNHELVKDGWCWWYRKYAPGNTVLEGLEKEAREAKKGLWVDPAPIPPWVYRKAKRGQALDLSDLAPLDAEGGKAIGRLVARHGETSSTNFKPSTTHHVLRSSCCVVEASEGSFSPCRGDR